MNNDNNLLIKNEVVKMSKIQMKKNAKLIFYIALQQKALSLINSSDEEYNIKKPSIINLETLKKVFKGQKSFKEMVLTIETTPKDFKIQENKTYRIISIFDEIVINTEKKEILFYFSKNSLKYFDVKNGNFTKINLNELILLSSDYSIKMYEVISMYSNLNNSIKIQFDTFKELFNIQSSYQTKDISTKILKPVINEINKKTKYIINIDKIKNNRKITHIILNINKKKGT
jgi:plasmid replication initiation protein